MTYRRFILFGFSAFLGYLLFMILRMDTAASSAGVWPLVIGILVILMLPEKRLGGKMIVDLVKAWKGK